MLFNSFSFLVFFPVVVFLYYILKPRWRRLFLLIASCYFYIVFIPKYILVLFFLITLDYFLAQYIERNTGRQRRMFLLISILANIGTLFIFKYFNFFSLNIAGLAEFIHWNYQPALLSWALPLGLSFHVFQSLSYVIEVYRGTYPTERNYITYALYVMFFPQLVAGPIERPGHLLPQLNITHQFNSLGVRQGLERMLWGFFKKLVIADQAAVIVDHLYGDLTDSGPILIFLSALFAFQIYCDFSGYSDIAVGSAMVLGYDLSENFNRPFSARSMADFWRRWHISLSNWLRDYLYYPLAIGWGKASKLKIYFSLFITFVLTGLWHGANWTFVAFGALHGIYMVVGALTEKSRQTWAKRIGLTTIPRIRAGWQVLSVFIMASLALIFFRAENITQAWYIISHLGTGFGDIFKTGFLANSPLRGLGLSFNGRAIIFPAIMLMELVQYQQTQRGTFYIFDTQPKIIRYAWYYLLIFLIIIFGYWGAQTFIYFQF